MTVHYQSSAGIIVYRLHDQIREYLVLHYVHGHWDLCKGKIEPGESKLDAATRELQEETGLRVLRLDTNFTASFAYIFNESEQTVHKTVYFFLGEVAAESHVELSAEHTDYRWLSFEQAYNKLTYANARQVLEQAELFFRGSF